MEPSKQKKTWRDSAPIDMFLSAVSVLVVVQLSSEVPKGLMNYPVYLQFITFIWLEICLCSLALCKLGRSRNKDIL